MTAAEDGNIVNNANTRKFIFRALAPLDNSKDQPAIAIPFLNQTPENNALFRFTGQTESVIFSFGIFDDGTDVSSGTNGTPIITVAQQITYLRDNVFSAEFDTDWTLTQPRFYPDGVRGVIEAVKFNNTAGAGTVVTGSFSFKRGRIGAL